MSNIQEKIEKYIEQNLVNWIVTQHGTAGWEQKLLNFILNTDQQAIIEERMRILEDMKLKMENWHGTGLAMIEDYKSLIQKDK